MNVNGSRFDLLLGRADWARCLEDDGPGARTLGEYWDAALTSPPQALPDELPAWDAQRSEIGIRPLSIELPSTPAETELALDARRGAAADRHGNVYRIGDDHTALLVTSAGSRQESRFWPESAAPAAHGDFAPHRAADAAQVESYRALAVTADDYLVVAFARGPERGFLSFDLLAGGPPLPTLWPAAVPFDPFDMAARHGGGVWVLDRPEPAPLAGPVRSPMLWELDCRLGVVAVAQASVTLVPRELDAFQPLSGPPREGPAVVFPAGVALTGSPGWTLDPIAVEALGEGAVLLLDRDAEARTGRVVRLRRDDAGWHADASRWLDELREPVHDFVYAAARLYQLDDLSPQLFITSTSGNQARAYAVEDAPETFALRGVTELFPLRRYAGRALLAIRGGARYDSGSAIPVWTPIVQQPRARFGVSAMLVTKVFDSAELGTTWDRVLLDACLPPETSLRIESRAADECTDLLDGAGSPEEGSMQVVGGWREEPAPYLRPNGSELPWLRDEAVRPTRAEAGVGTWELLLQGARGRYLQLRIRFASVNGVATPRLRALRVWSPRFSYAQRFLPAVYREEAGAASFLERWLANIEGTLTGMEERIVNVQALFDPRTAPDHALEWLAGWFEVAADPAWDERRRRLFLRNAMDFFRWRGTVHGLRLALELAFGECFDPELFQGPADALQARGIRIVEAFQTRLLGALAAGDPAGAAGPREVRPEARWTPAEGNAGLVQRYAMSLGRTVAPALQITPFPLVPPADQPEQWRVFLEAALGMDPAADTAERARRQPALAGRWGAFLEDALGFIPSAGAVERARWQHFLATRYANVAALSAAHATAYAQLANVGLPRDFPAVTQAAQDWTQFCATTDGSWTRVRWQDFLARRYRRIDRLNRAYGTAWPDFDRVALPDALPGTEAAQTDWLLFERELLSMHRTAHRFSVLLPVAEVTADPYALETRLGLARRIAELEKPAHTVFDVRFYWAFFRVGEARLGLDTLLGAGSRARELIPEAVLGRAYIGASFVGGAARPRQGDRMLLAC